MLHRPLIIAVVGGTGSGKTTVATAIHEAVGLGAVLLDQDAVLPRPVGSHAR